MKQFPRCDTRWRFAVGVFLAGLAWPGALALHAQTVYTSIPGETSLYSNYDPTAASSTPARRGTPGSRRFLPATPHDRYLAQKAEMAGYSRSTFTDPAELEIAPLPRATGTPGPIVAAPTISWQGLQDTGFQPPTPDSAAGPSDVVMVVNSTIAQFTKSGSLVQSTSFQSWFADVLANIPCSPNCLIFDPWIAYDQLHGRFLFLAGATPNDLSSRTYS